MGGSKIMHGMLNGMSGGQASIGEDLIGLGQQNPATAQQPIATRDIPELMGQSAPNVLKPMQKYITPLMGNGPIYNPNDILNAYAQHMPEFLDAARSVPNATNMSPKLYKAMNRDQQAAANKQAQADINAYVTRLIKPTNNFNV